MARRWDKKLTLAYRNTFTSPEGERVLADLGKRCPLLRSSIRADKGIDVNKLLFLEGQRSVLLHIYSMLNRDPNAETQDKAINEFEGE